MRAILHSVLIVILAVSHALAADNAKQVEAIARKYAGDLAKADEVRGRALDKSRSEAIVQLSKLASRAFAEKDRVSETRAWKAILTIDRSHERAIQYFKDLGTLDATLAELPEDTDKGSFIPLTLAGRWRFYRDNQARTAFCEYLFQDDGSILIKRGENAPELWGKYALENNSIIARDLASDISRFTVVGNRIIQEQWHDGFPDSTPNWFYFGIRVE